MMWKSLRSHGSDKRKRRRLFPSPVLMSSYCLYQPFSYFSLLCDHTPPQAVSVCLVLFCCLFSCCWLCFFFLSLWFFISLRSCALLPLFNLFFLVFSVAVLLSGLRQSTPALVDPSAASWMRTRPSALMVPHLPQLCRQATVTSGPRRDESGPRGTETTWAEPTCTLPQTSLRVMVSGKPVPHSGHTHIISVFYSLAWGWNNIRPYLSSVHMLQIIPASPSVITLIQLRPQQQSLLLAFLVINWYKS